jgi:predicted Zn-dependent protease
MFGIHCEAERYADAERVILDLIREWPEEADYYAKYAILMLQTLHVEKARALAAEALRLDPDGEDALIASALSAYVTDPSAEAEQRLRELVRRYPSSAQTLRVLVDVLVQRRRFHEALVLAREILRANPHDEALVDAIVALKVNTHWSMKPLWPVLRFGWAGSAGLWACFIAATTILRRSPYESWVGPIAIVFLAYVVYSWVYPSMLTRLMKR